MLYRLKSVAVVAALSACSLAQASPTNYSFRGNFVQDDNVQLFNFSVGASSSVTLVSFGYAGGVQADGTVIQRGGFDTILALFDGTGQLIQQNDDSPSSVCGGVTVGTDAFTSARFDTCLNLTLAAGNYTVAVMEFDNFANGPSLSNGFTRQGQGNFTASVSQCTQGRFCDVTATATYTNRTSAWAFDVRGVDTAVQNNVPEPATLALTSLALLGLGGVRRARKS